MEKARDWGVKRGNKNQIVERLNNNLSQHIPTKSIPNSINAQISTSLNSILKNRNELLIQSKRYKLKNREEDNLEPRITQNNTVSDICTHRTNEQIKEYIHNSMIIEENSALKSARIGSHIGLNSKREGRNIEKHNLPNTYGKYKSTKLSKTYSMSSMITNNYSKYLLNKLVDSMTQITERTPNHKMVSAHKYVKNSGALRIIDMGENGGNRKIMAKNNLCLKKHLPSVNYNKFMKNNHIKSKTPFDQHSHRSNHKESKEGIEMLSGSESVMSKGELKILEEMSENKGYNRNLNIKNGIYSNNRDPHRGRTSYIPKDYRNGSIASQQPIESADTLEKYSKAFKGLIVSRLPDNTIQQPFNYFNSINLRTNSSIDLYNNVKEGSVEYDKHPMKKNENFALWHDCYRNLYSKEDSSADNSDDDILNCRKDVATNTLDNEGRLSSQNQMKNKIFPNNEVNFQFLMNKMNKTRRKQMVTPVNKNLQKPLIKLKSPKPKDKYIRLGLKKPSSRNNIVFTTHIPHSSISGEEESLNIGKLERDNNSKPENIEISRLGELENDNLEIKSMRRKSLKDLNIQGSIHPSINTKEYQKNNSNSEKESGSRIEYERNLRKNIIGNLNKLLKQRGQSSMSTINSKRKNKRLLKIRRSNLSINNTINKGAGVEGDKRKSSNLFGTNDICSWQTTQPDIFEFEYSQREIMNACITYKSKISKMNYYLVKWNTGNREYPLLGTGGENGGDEISLYADSLELLGSLKGHSGQINSIIYIRGGMASGDEESEIKIWELSSKNKHLKECLRGIHTQAITALCMLHNNNKFLASGSYDSKIVIWGREEGEREILQGGEQGESIESIVEYRRRYLLATDGAATLTIWDLYTYTSIYTNHNFGLSLQVFTTHEYVLANDYITHIYIWKLDTHDTLCSMKLMNTINSKLNREFDAYTEITGGRIVLGVNTGGLDVLDLQSGQLLQSVAQDLPPVRDVVPILGDIIGIVCNQGHILILDPILTVCYRYLYQHPQAFTSIAKLKYIYQLYILYIFSL